MRNISLDISNVFSFASKDEIYNFQDKATAYNAALYNKKGKGNEFLGWVTLPNDITDTELEEINYIAQSLQNKAEYVVVIGIGGSYLGAKMIIEALNNTMGNSSDKTQILFAGQNISEDYLFDLKEFLKNKSFALVNISKSGTTTEPAIAFRLLKNLLEKKYDKNELKDRIVAITDKKKGALKQLAEEEGYKTFVVPDDVGGRFSVLTPVGLLPIAIAGYDIKKLISGAQEIEKSTAASIHFENNISALYAATRNAIYQKGKTIEILANYEPKLFHLGEWWKQLYGESEGKENKGIFPASVNLTTDLHSLGQYIQEGNRILFETVISVNESKNTLKIPKDEKNLDGLNYLAGKRISEVNKMAELGTQLAHIDGGVPIIKIEIPQITEYYLGQLLYFFEKACGISGHILGINPFDQPGVEAYKKNMFALLNKPGFEKTTKELQNRLN